MITSLQCESVPEAQSTNHALELLARVRDGELPVFAMHNAGVSHVGLFGGLQKAMGQHDLYPDGENPEISPLEFMTEADRQRGPVTPGATIINRDFGLHMDDLPQAEELPASKIAVHLTARGALVAAFMEPEPGLQASGDFIVSEHLARLFQQGKTDTEQLNPRCWQVAVQPQTLVVFRVGGHKPLAHDFTTVQWPRYSEVSVWEHEPLAPVFETIENILPKTLPDKLSREWLLQSDYNGEIWRGYLGLDKRIQQPLARRMAIGLARQGNLVALRHLLARGAAQGKPGNPNCDSLGHGAYQINDSLGEERKGEPFRVQLTENSEFSPYDIGHDRCNCTPVPAVSPALPLRICGHILAARLRRAAEEASKI